MRDCPRKGQLAFEPTCGYLPPLSTTGLRSAVPQHFIDSLAGVQIRGSVTRCRVGRPAASSALALDPKAWIAAAACYKQRSLQLRRQKQKEAMASVDRAVLRVFSAISLLVLSLSELVIVPDHARAETAYPNKSVRIVLPFAAGGVADTTARIIAEKLGDRLGQRFYVENQPGAGGIAAARTVISSAPDGYTLALLSNGTAVSVSLFKKLPFDPLRDFEPISSLGFFDFVFATGANSEFKTLADFIAAARAKPGTLNVGTINIGSIQNLSAELFKTSAGIDFTIISYRATPEIQGRAAARRYCPDDRQLLVDEGQPCRQQVPGAGIVGSGALGKYA